MEDQSNFIILTVVGIVAIIALVVLVIPGKTQDLTGRTTVTSVGNLGPRWGPGYPPQPTHIPRLTPFNPDLVCGGPCTPKFQTGGACPEECPTCVMPYWIYPDDGSERRRPNPFRPEGRCQ